jgi:hypothetical protein
MPGLTTGPIAALSLSPPRLEVAGRSFAVQEVGLLRRLKIGDHVTVAWEEAGADLQAVRITPEKPIG